MLRFEDRFAGRTVLSVLRELGFSSTAITALKKKENGILLDDNRVTVRTVIAPGSVLEIHEEDETAPAKSFPSLALPPDILREDDALLVVNKAAGMPTHPSHGHIDDTLANVLLAHYRSAGIPFVFRAVNRLDHNTSGTVLLAKSGYTAALLGDAMKNGKIHKTYLAILRGTVHNKSGEIETYIRRREASVIFREICPPSPDAQEARTVYRILAEGDGLSLVEATPLTGRTHQLRLHFRHIGAPILGDDLYDRPSEETARHLLHARRLSFDHPTTGMPVTVTAPLPDDMKTVLRTHFRKEDLPFDVANELS